MSQVDEIKDRLSIVDVVSQYVTLEKAGRNFKGKSPFTNEKTPSFFVSPDKNMFYCFSSNKGGDIFTFVQEMERVDFMGALKILADKAGVELKKIDPKKRDERERLYEVLETSAHFYQKNFSENKSAFAYMLSRGIRTETLKEFQVGFAPDMWDGLLKYLKQRSFTEKEIINSGLALSREGRVYDRFRSRIMFPICDTAGRVIGFSGRIYEEGEKTLATLSEHSTASPGTGQAKYINTPETLLYHKSNVLYGFDKAKEHIRKQDASILVEGQMDVLASFEGGIRNTVAVSGTSLTPDHLKILNRFTDNILLALDSDRAGLNASDKSARTALSLGMNVSVIPLPLGTDPADLVKDDPKKWQEVVMKPKEYTSFRIGRITERKKEEDPSEEIKLNLFPHVFVTEGSIRKDRILKEIARGIGGSLESVRDEYREWERISRKEGSMIQTPQKHSSHQSPWKGSRKEMVQRRIVGIMEWQSEEEKPTLDIEKFKNGYAALVEGRKEGMIQELTDIERGRLSLEAQLLYEGNEEMKKESLALLGILEVEIINEELEQLSRKLWETDPQAGVESQEIMKQYQKLQSRKEELKRNAILL